MIAEQKLLGLHQELPPVVISNDSMDLWKNLYKKVDIPIALWGFLYAELFQLKN